MSSTSARPQRAILVTGANKGIGYAICDKTLADAADTFVLLGSRSAERGEAAVKRLQEKHSPSRVQLLLLDVQSNKSVAQAKDQVAALLKTRQDLTLWAVVNNAGGTGTGQGLGFSDADSFRLCQDLNFTGCVRVTEAFLPLLEKFGGSSQALPRIVNINSGAGPGFVKNCSAAYQQLLTDADKTLHDLNTLVDTGEQLLRQDNPLEALKAAGLGAGSWGMTQTMYYYGFSKALMNAWTRQLAKRTKGRVLVNSCSPGLVHTDLTQPFCEIRQMNPEQMNMLTPAQGARTPCRLLLDPAVDFTGRFYGSDGLRSPFHTSRDPDKDPEYQAPPEEEL
ncbi:unnamed protein product [Amoebophrya sp. A120]|nr:unnamed protein product [Amoebophrya sp. A120]|eukprot:GSA120T00001096001.1